MENNSGSSAGGYGGNKGGYLKSGSDKYKKDKPFVPQDRVKLSNIEREVSNLKTKLFNIEQYFSQERPGHHFDVLEIFFLDGTREKFTDVNIKKYTMVAVDSKMQETHILKSAIRYYKVI